MNSEFIQKMMNSRQVGDKTYSILVTALEDARQLSGFDKETGKQNLLLLNINSDSILELGQPSLIKYPADADRLTRGSPSGKGNHFTKICAESLRDFIENVFQQIKEGVNDGNVESYLSDAQVQSKFTYSH